MRGRFSLWEILPLKGGGTGNRMTIHDVLFRDGYSEVHSVSK